LLIEDNLGDARLIREIMAEARGDQFELERADRLSTGLERLAAGGIDVILLDLGLPDSMGFDTFTSVHAQVLEVPIIVLTGLSDEALAVKAVREGAQDYLVKGQVDANLLLRTVRYAIERKRAERVLQRSKREWESTFDAMADWVCLLDLEARILRSNQVGEEFVGVPLAEMVGQNCCKLLHGTEKPIPGCPLQKMLQTRQREIVELRLPGEDRWLMITVDPVMDNDGTVVSTVHIVRDVTARRRAEEELRRVKEFNESIVQNMAEGIVMQDSEGTFTFVNPAAAELLGYRPEEILDQRWTLIVSPDQWPTVRDVDQRRMHGEADRYELELIRQDGTRVPVLVTASPIFEEERFAGTLAVFTDITEQKQAEEELRQSFERLRRSLEGTVTTLISAVEMRDPYTAGHQRRVAELACAIAQELDLSEEQIDGTRMAGLVHDIGKISIPAEILSKPIRLSELEWSMIQAHPKVSHNILKTIDFPWPVAEIVFQHHERLDGSGYPAGLMGEEIILEARILGMADVVEAMASFRPYRPARGIDEALEEISQNSGILYDPEVVGACLKLFTEKGFAFE